MKHLSLLILPRLRSNRFRNYGIAYRLMRLQRHTTDRKFFLFQQFQMMCSTCSLLRLQSFLQFVAHNGFELFGDFERGHILFFDEHFFARSRIVRNAFIFFAHVERAEASDFNALARFERFNNGLYESINDGFGFLLG